MATQAISGPVANGPRPMNLNRDAQQVMTLLELVFRPSLGADGRRILSGSLTLGNQPNFLLRISQLAGGATPGFVWQQDGRIVGNVSLLMSGMNGRYLIANVAVHPDYRRQGIARRLMEITLEHVRHQHGNVVLLQVKEANDGAKRLYRELGFAEIGDVTTWTASHSSLRTVGAAPLIPEIRPLRGSEWRDAIVLDRSSVAADLNWPQPLPAEAYKRGLWQRMQHFFNGQSQEVWAAVDAVGQLQGLAAIQSIYGRPFELRLRVHPEQRGQLERALLDKLLRRLRYMRRRQVKIEHPATDELLNQLLEEANFRPRHTLTTMKLTL